MSESRGKHGRTDAVTGSASSFEVQIALRAILSARASLRDSAENCLGHYDAAPGSSHPCLPPRPATPSLPLCGCNRPRRSATDPCRSLGGRQMPRSAVECSRSSGRGSTERNGKVDLSTSAASRDRQPPRAIGFAGAVIGSTPARRLLHTDAATPIPFHTPRQQPRTSSVHFSSSGPSACPQQ